ncbi:MAG: HupE/UreJ family protein [Opitutaceae bacterium]|jgi:urease accessory protein
MKSRLASRFLKLGTVLAFLPAIASAHPGHDGDHGFGWDFSGGFVHPLGGWDHLLAMIAVGLWAAQLGGRARWLVPAAFVSVMTLGAVLGHGGLQIAGTEQGIAASVLVLGLLVATAARLPAAASMAIVGVFALFHGLAHGAEMPATSAGLSYGLGFVLATSLLHAAGLGLGQLTARKSAVIPQTAGAAIALVGVAMLTF